MDPTESEAKDITTAVTLVPAPETKPESQPAPVANIPAATNVPTAINPTAPVELGAQAPGTTTPTVVAANTSATPFKKIKIVIAIDNNGALIGIQKQDCDPLTYQAKDLAGALKGIPTFLDLANREWEGNPRFPKAAEAVTPAAAKPAAMTAAKTTSTPVKPVKPVPKNKLQNSIM